MRKISASDAAKLAALRAQVHELELARLKEESAERKARSRRQNRIVAMAASVVVALVLTAGITYMATAPTVDRTAVAKQRPDDRFNQTREGIVRFAEGEGRLCRQVDFNNTSGRFSNEAQVTCYDPKLNDIGQRLPQEQGGMAFDGIRSSFRR